MTATPHTIGHNQSLTTGHRLMREHHVRHLPVLDGGRVVGVLSERDLALLESIPGVNPTDVRIEEAMNTDIYAVAPEDPLDSVSREMAERKLGSAVVMDNDQVIGIFTTVDALNALAQLIRPIA